MATRVKPARGGGTLYETDVVAWAERQAEALRAGRFDELDLENLAEEIGDVSRREAEALESHLETLVMHLLKWRHDPDHRSRSWKGTIRVAYHKTTSSCGTARASGRGCRRSSRTPIPPPGFGLEWRPDCPKRPSPPPALSPSIRSPATGCQRSSRRADRQRVARSLAPGAPEQIRHPQQRATGFMAIHPG